MRAVVQRVGSASVAIEGHVVGRIDRGMMILVCVEQGDSDDDLLWLTRKIAGLRIFNDAEGVMNLDIRQIGGGVLAISQFTLVASTRKGNRPSYIRAAQPAEGERMYLRFCEELSTLLEQPVERGVFGADMQVSLINDGPVTIIIDSRLRE